MTVSTLIIQTQAQESDPKQQGVLKQALTLGPRALQSDCESIIYHLRDIEQIRELTWGLNFPLLHGDHVTCLSGLVCKPVRWGSEEWLTVNSVHNSYVRDRSEGWVGGLISHSLSTLTQASTLSKKCVYFVNIPSKYSTESLPSTKLLFLDSSLIETAKILYMYSIHTITYST